MKNKGLFLFLVLFFLVSCDSEKKRPAPAVLLSESQMVDILMDVQLMEATISYKKSANQKTEYLKRSYDTIFSHYGVTDSIFKENMTYYYDVEPQILMRIMDSVETRFAKMKN